MAMMTTRIFLLLFTIALSWCGCSTNDDESGAPIARTDGDDARLIRVSASAIDVIVSQSTRTVVVGGTFLNTQTRVLATANADNYATLHCNGTMTFNGTAASGYADGYSGSKYFPAAGTVYLSGLYPSSGWGCDSGTAIENGTVTHGVDGKTDLLYAASVTSTLGGTTAELEFNHVLTLLQLSLKKAVTTTITVKKIELKGTAASNGFVNTTCSVALNGKTVSFSGGSDGTTIPCYLTTETYTDTPFTGQSVALTMSAVEKAYVLAPALTDSEVDSDTDYTLSVTYSIDATDQPVVEVPLQLTTNGTIPFNATTAGKSFGITLNFIGGAIKTAASITDWSSEGTFSVDIN
jgi:hypothetical protein